MTDGESVSTEQRDRRGSALEVLLAFLKLGTLSFGGPIAHLGYFRDAFVVRRRWLDEHAYADLLSLCQFLPGPASSQVGFAIGLARAGYRGGVAAWTGFTLPSAVALILFAYGASALHGPLSVSVLHGLKLVAVSIVAQAVWGMARTLCPDWQRAVIAVASAGIVLFAGSNYAQLVAIAFGGVIGLMACRPAPIQMADALAIAVSRRVGTVALVFFTLLLVGLPVLRGLVQSQHVALFEAFYRSGALVFGGGHVVLPLLREAFVASGWMTDDMFLAGYGATQAVPGPLFTFAAYLGAVADSSRFSLFGAALGLVGIFLPGMLILLGTLPFWSILRQRPYARASMAGVNAAVVGLLAAALYNPLWITAVDTLADFVIALLGFILLVAWRTPALAVVVLTVVGAAATATW